MSLKGKIVFSSGRSADFDIFVLDLDSGAVTQLSTGKDYNDYPRWSPDASQIVFVSDRDDGIMSLWLMDANGRNLRRLTQGIHCGPAAWSPDGRQLLFTANAEDPNEIEICTLDLKFGAQPQVLLRRPGQETEPSWSPDGRRIVFSALSLDQSLGANRNSEIWEYLLESQDLVRLTDHPARDYGPVFSPDGNRIAFVSHRDGMKQEAYFEKLKEINVIAKQGKIQALNAAIRELLRMEQDSDIWVMDADGKNLRQLTKNSGIDVGVAWSPCGNYLVYSSAPKGKAAAERLKILDSGSGSEIALTYDRSLLLQEIDAAEAHYMNLNLVQKLIPNFIERRLVDPSFWGEERHPDWTHS